MSIKSTTNCFAKMYLKLLGLCMRSKKYKKSEVYSKCILILNRPKRYYSCTFEFDLFPHEFTIVLEKSPGNASASLALLGRGGALYIFYA